MVRTEQPVVDRGEPLRHLETEADRAAAERAARESLRAQVARLERELSGIVARGFPHVAPAPAAIGAGSPRLLSLAELERLRDRLALRVHQAQDQARRRSELEWRSRDLLERMRLEPGRYKFMRLPVVDLGERGCGVWEVRPRLGLIGMLAGWWQLKLSSGCPLPGAVRFWRAAFPGAGQHGPTRVARPRGPGSRHNCSPRSRGEARRSAAQPLTG